LKPLALARGFFFENRTPKFFVPQNPEKKEMGRTNSSEEENYLVLISIKKSEAV